MPARKQLEERREDFVRSNVPPVGSFPTSVKLREDGADLRQIGTTCLCKTRKDWVFMISKKTIAKQIYDYNLVCLYCRMLIVDDVGG